MSRVRKIEKLTKIEQMSLLNDLIHALIQVKSVNETARFLQDLLTKSELIILSKRLRIAKLLLAGSSYADIESQIKVSHGTIAKIAAWLTESGEGFREIISKLPKEIGEEEHNYFNEWGDIKRKFSMYFWPELLLEEIIKSANKRQKERLKNVLKLLDDKNKLHKNIEKLLNSSTT